MMTIPVSVYVVVLSGRGPSRSRSSLPGELSHQAAPLAGWELPEQFTCLRRLLEARLGKPGRVLRLLEDFRFEHVAAAVRQACELGAIWLGHVLCRKQRSPRLDLTKYPHLPAAQVEQTSAALLAQGGG